MKFLPSHTHTHTHTHTTHSPAQLAEAEQEGSSGGDPSASLEAAGAAFERAIHSCGAKKDLEALMGLAKLCQVREQHKEALDLLSQVIGMHSWFLPALEEKASVLMALGDWDQALETAQRVLAQDGGNIVALRMCTLYLLSHESLTQEAASKLDELRVAIERQEPMNASLFHAVSRPFARLGGRTPHLLQKTLALCQKACSLQPQRAEYAAELGYQQMLAGDLPSAMHTLKMASSLEEGSDEVMPLLIKCQILSGELVDAEIQVRRDRGLHSISASLISISGELVDAEM